MIDKPITSKQKAYVQWLGHQLGIAKDLRYSMPHTCKEANAVIKYLAEQLRLVTANKKDLATVQSEYLQDC